MATIELDSSNFSDSVMSSGDILVDFFATWCGPCRTMAKVLDDISADGVRIGKVDIDKEPELARKWGVSSVPTLIFFRDGSPTAKTVGVKTRKALMDMMQS